MTGLGPLLRTALFASVVYGIALVLTTWLQVAMVGTVTPPWTLTMVEQSWETGEWPARKVRRLARLGDAGPRAMVASEDARFFLHRGFDNEAICQALLDAWNGDRLRGASTITQQVSKNVFLWGNRSMQRKVVEAWYAYWMERLLSKERILELYVNVAETGPRIYGLEAGAQHHFDKPAASLSDSEAGRLAGILPNPQRSVDGKAAWQRAAWVAKHPAPFPGDPFYDATLRAWQSQSHSLVGCFF